MGRTPEYTNEDPVQNSQLAVLMGSQRLKMLWQLTSDVGMAKFIS